MDGETLERLRWGVVANAGRLSAERKPRWSHVMDAVGLGSTSAWELCRAAGFDPDHLCGGADEAPTLLTCGLCHARHFDPRFPNIASTPATPGDAAPTDADRRALGLDNWRFARAPSLEVAPRATHHIYRCSKCGTEQLSGPMPEPPDLAVYPLPAGWVLVPVADLNVDDDLHCQACAPAPPVEPGTPPCEGSR